MEKAKLTATGYTPESVFKKLYVDDKSPIVIVGDGNHASQKVRDMVTRVNTLPYDNLNFIEWQKWMKLPADFYTPSQWGTNLQTELKASQKSGARVTAIDVDAAMYKEYLSYGYNSNTLQSAILNVSDTATRHKVYQAMTDAMVELDKLKKQYQKELGDGRKRDFKQIDKLDAEYGLKASAISADLAKLLQDTKSEFPPQYQKTIEKQIKVFEHEAGFFKDKGFSGAIERRMMRKTQGS